MSSQFAFDNDKLSKALALIRHFFPGDPSEYVNQRLRILLKEGRYEEVALWNALAAILDSTSLNEALDNYDWERALPDGAKAQAVSRRIR